VDEVIAAVNRNNELTKRETRKLSQQLKKKE
jgi:hypothetical protein